MIDEAIEELASIVGTTAACAAVGRPRQTLWGAKSRSHAATWLFMSVLGWLAGPN